MAVSVLTNVTNDPIAKRFGCTFTVDATETASGVYCGFKPRVIRMTQTAGSPDATSRSYWFDGMTNAYAVLVAAAGDLTIVTTNGFTIQTGGEQTGSTAAVAKATGSPNPDGPGFVVGTGVTANSLVYYLEAEG